MSDLSILIRSKIDQSQQAIEALNNNLSELEKKINSLNIKININDKDTSAFTSKIIKEANSVQKQTEGIFAKPIKINTTLEGLSKQELEKTIKLVRDNVDSISKIDIKTDPAKNIESALITYKDGMGKVVQETMEWKTQVLETGQELKTFETSGFKFVNDIEKANKETVKLQQNAQKIVDTFNKSNLNGSDFWIQQKDLEGKQFSKALQSQMQKSVIEEGDLEKEAQNLKKIEDHIKQVNNSLDKMKVNKDKVFSDSRVEKEVETLKKMEEQYKKGEVSAKDYALQLDNVRTKSAQVSGELRNVNKDGYSFVSMVELAAKKVIDASYVQKCA